MKEAEWDDGAEPGVDVPVEDAVLERSYERLGADVADEFVDEDENGRKDRRTVHGAARPDAKVLRKAARSAYQQKERNRDGPDDSEEVRNGLKQAEFEDAVFVADADEQRRNDREPAGEPSRDSGRNRLHPPLGDRVCGGPAELRADFSLEQHCKTEHEESEEDPRHRRIGRVENLPRFDRLDAGDRLVDEHGAVPLEIEGG